MGRAQHSKVGRGRVAIELARRAFGNVRVSTQLKSKLNFVMFPREAVGSQSHKEMQIVAQLVNGVESIA